MLKIKMFSVLVKSVTMLLPLPYDRDYMLIYLFILDNPLSDAPGILHVCLFSKQRFIYILCIHTPIHITLIMLFSCYILI